MAIGDPLAAWVSAIVQGLGPDGTTSFSDISANAKTVTRTGSMFVTTGSTKFGGALWWPFNGNSYLSLPANDPMFTFGTGGFAVEFWLKVPSIASGVFNYPIFMGNGGTAELALRINPGGGIVLSLPGGASLGGGSLVANTWYHIAVTRDSGGTLRLFLNGVLLNSTTDTSNFASCSVVAIGAVPQNSWWSNNIMMDDIRISRVPRYTSGFPAPTARSLPYASRISGTVRDAAGAPAQRLVRVYARSNGAFLKAVQSSATTGDYVAPLVTDPGECNVVFLDDAAGATYNDLIHRAIAY